MSPDERIKRWPENTAAIIDMDPSASPATTRCGANSGCQVTPNRGRGFLLSSIAFRQMPTKCTFSFISPPRSARRLRRVEAATTTGHAALSQGRNATWRKGGKRARGVKISSPSTSLRLENPTGETTMHQTTTPVRRDQKGFTIRITPPTPRRGANMPTRIWRDKRRKQPRSPRRQPEE